MNKEFKKKYKNLFKFYEKKLKELHKRDLKSLIPSTDYFILNLMLLRDYYLLMEPLVVGTEENMKTVILATAIEEYEAYNSCVDKYFNFGKKGLERKDSSKTQEEVLKEYNEEKAFHWTYFWQLIESGMQSWVGDISAAI